MALGEDISIRQTGKVGRITLTRPKALNAMTYEMCLAIEKAVDGWVEAGAVDLVVIDAEGDRAFCAGGDIADLYASGKAGDHGFGRKFWADEYRLNAKLANLAIPYVALAPLLVTPGKDQSVQANLPVDQPVNLDTRQPDFTISHGNTVVQSVSRSC